MRKFIDPKFNTIFDSLKIVVQTASNLRRKSLRPVYGFKTYVKQKSYRNIASVSYALSALSDAHRGFFYESQEFSLMIAYTQVVAY